MKKLLYKKMFILVMFVLFIIFYSIFSIDIVDLQKAISPISLYFIGTHFVYGAIFKTKVYFPVGGGHDMGKVGYGVGIVVLLIGSCLILLSLLNLSGYLNMFDLMESEK